MILVTRFNGSQIYLNAELIQFVEQTPDTIITLVNNVKIVVKETAGEIADRVLAYRRAIYNYQPTLSKGE